MSPIIGGPQFIVRIPLSRSISSFALRLMQVCEIYSYDYAFGCFRDFSWNIVIVAVVILNHCRGLKHGSIYNELLRDWEGLNDNVCDINRCLRYFQLMPCLSFVECVEYISGRGIMLGHNYQATVIPELINVGTFTDLIPVQTAISWEVCWHPILDIPPY